MAEQQRIEELQRLKEKRKREIEEQRKRIEDMKQNTKQQPRIGGVGKTYKDIIAQVVGDAEKSGTLPKIRQLSELT